MATASDAAMLEPVPCREGTTCLSCRQSPNDVERDLLPEKVEKVAWERKAKDSSGLRGSGFFKRNAAVKRLSLCCASIPVWQAVAASARGTNVPSARVSGRAAGVAFPSKRW